MLRRVQCTYRRALGLAIVPVALALVSCGGSPVAESVSGPSATAVSVDPAAPDDGTLTESGKNKNKNKNKNGKSKVLLCHKGRDLWVSSSAVAGHLRHGDTLGSCSAPDTCPCFSALDIQAAASECSTTVTSTCSADDPYYLFLSCDPAPPELGVYLSQSSGEAYCERTDVLGSFTQSGLTDAEYQACVDAINDSGYCF
jgi:hypothetical protein